MAASSSSLINIGDPNHIYAVLTQENHHDSPLFKNIPIEIRLIIYEYAVAIDKPVRPRQMAPRSNKFVWGKTDNDGRSRFTGVVLKSDEEPLVVVSLSRTCRSIYRELEDHPVFYRVNRFEFDFAQDLHTFLAAILPKRLAMIRTIRLITGEALNPWAEDWGGQVRPAPHVALQPHNRPPNNHINHILTLLSRCDDLRELSLVLHQNVDFGGMESKLYGWDTLADGSHEAPAFINLPIFDVFMRFSLYGEEFHLKKALGRSELQQGPQARNYLSAIVRGLDARKKAFALKGKSDEEKDNHPQWLKDMANRAAINAAIRAAPVDFTGGNRIAQDMHLMSDTVSSRTRRKGQVVNSFGVVHREVPKYTADGQVAWTYLKVTGIRWNDSGELELQLLWEDPTRDRYDSWASFHAFPKDRQGEENIIRFFRNTATGLYRDVEAHLREVHSIPSPSDVAKFAGGLNHFLDKDTMFAETTQTVRQRRIHIWNHWIKRWDRYVARLEKELDKKKKEAAKAAAAATEDSKKAKKARKGNQKAMKKSAK
ncbi:uncharacterized protein F4817DRAFT_365195 [Daldinia loculata]|uniref:uncharacterized protein n=1 Tax=Daldinia loculata TaxID=103429 RepID=UPI0020C2246C|nr:uncharacterized protein F4817DRAFT_365195 [Daldinia loculata]KAI1647753.1 hypothetical protein F4817DRAFT_365195 [Daldinia loculata]